MTHEDPTLDAPEAAELAAGEQPEAEVEASPEELARAIASMTWDRKALNTVVIDLRGRVYYTDFLVICSGTSDRQIQAIARHIESTLRDSGYRPITSEGVDSGRWALLDYSDVILHVFNLASRQEFDLEGMWLDAPRLTLEDAPEALYGQFDLSAFS